MQIIWSALCVLACVYSGGAVTTTPGSPGISQFWTDDYKVFQQVYGKTSDKDLYGKDLPPPVTFDVNKAPARTVGATEKRQRFLDDEIISGSSPEVDIYDYNQKHNVFSMKKTKQALKDYQKVLKSTKSPPKFMPYTVPVTDSDDVETYKYLKHLEQMSKHNNGIPLKAVRGFKSYSSRGIDDFNDPYKSIQGLFEAHEANIRLADSQSKYQDDIAFVNSKETIQKARNKINPRQVQSNHAAKTRCTSGVCRNRKGSGHVRSYGRPVQVRKVKHTSIPSLVFSNY